MYNDPMKNQDWYPLTGCTCWVRDPLVFLFFFCISELFSKRTRKSGLHNNALQLNNVEQSTAAKDFF